jgi:hypothetical protein
MIYARKPQFIKGTDYCLIRKENLFMMVSIALFLE